MKSLRTLNIFILILLTLFLGYAKKKKSRAQLEKERKSIERKILLTKKLIRKTSNKKQSLITRIRLLDKQIKLRERLLKNLEEEIKTLDIEMHSLGGIIQAMQNDRKTYLENLAKITYVMYKKNQEFSLLLWLLASDSFKQAYDRLRYYHAFKEYRSLQISLLERTEKRLKEKFNLLDLKKKEKKELLQKMKEEKENLKKSKAKRQKIYKQIKRQERKYKNQLSSYKRRLVRIRKAIDKLIKEEIRRSKLRMRKDLLYKLSRIFSRNKGKLPWPVPANKGVITGLFGKQKDLTGGYVFNPGIYITTKKGQQVRAVFSGEVTAVSKIPILGNIVIIQHGNYRTVYANLSKVYVKVGTKVRALQKIGTVRTDPKTGETQLHFLIYKGKTPQDPLKWIALK